MVSDRTFGVEVECTYGETPNKKSLNHEYESLNHEYDWREQQKARAVKEIKATADFKRWAERIGIDGSGIEIRSPILSGQEGIEEFRAFMDFLIEKGSSVTNQDGMHVHHGALDFKDDGHAVLRLVKSWADLTPTINLMVAKRRRTSNMCRANWTDATIKKLEVAVGSEYAELEKAYNKQLEEYRANYHRGVYGTYPRMERPDNIVDRGALNINGIWRGKNTVEIRLSEGLMCSDSAVAWVKFGQSFLDSIIERKTPLTCTNHDALFTAIKLDDDAKEILKAKIANDGKALARAAKGKLANGIDYDESED